MFTFYTIHHNHTVTLVYVFVMIICGYVSKVLIVWAKYKLAYRVIMPPFIMPFFTIHHVSSLIPNVSVFVVVLIGSFVWIRNTFPYPDRICNPQSVRANYRLKH